MSSRLKNRIVFFVAVVIAVIMTACSGKHHAHSDEYTCPMHPSVLADKPGACPICGMDLVLRHDGQAGAALNVDITSVAKPPDEVVVSSARVIHAEFKSRSIQTSIEGKVAYDARKTTSIPSVVSGRLEKVLVRYNLESIKKGQLIAELYSPELIIMQRELLFLQENDRENLEMIRHTEDKLLRLGIDRSHLEELKAKKVVNHTVPIYSPVDGYIVAETDSLLRAGTYVAAGERLFSVIDKNALRVELSVREKEISVFHLGDRITLSIVGKDVEGIIDLIQPFYSSGEQFAKIRVSLNDLTDVRPGELVNVALHTRSTEMLWLPREAVIDLGENKIVFVKERDVFKAKIIAAGETVDRWIQVSGVASSDEIAANAQFMIDSESFIKPSR